MSPLPSLPIRPVWSAAEYPSDGDFDHQEALDAAAPLFDVVLTRRVLLLEPPRWGRMLEWATLRRFRGLAA